MTLGHVLFWSVIFGGINMAIAAIISNRLRPKVFQVWFWGGVATWMTAVLLIIWCMSNDGVLYLLIG